MRSCKAGFVIRLHSSYVRDWVKATEDLEEKQQIPFRGVQVILRSGR